MDNAWSGGTPGSIFTYPSGPYASKIIYEFFMAHPNPNRLASAARGGGPQVTLAELDQRLARIEARSAAATASPQRAQECRAGNRPRPAGSGRVRRRRRAPAGTRLSTCWTGSTTMRSCAARIID